MGNYVTISHGNGISTVYMHCSALYVSAGQYVSQGEAIAAMGSTGISTGPHLHYEVRLNGTRVDPELYLY
jgi:murein DD-endopeptidase MepM/ murein hydrolase activator NlpD